MGTQITVLRVPTSDCDLYLINFFEFFIIFELSFLWFVKFHLYFRMNCVIYTPLQLYNTVKMTNVIIKKVILDLRRRYILNPNPNPIILPLFSFPK